MGAVELRARRQAVSVTSKTNKDIVLEVLERAFIDHDPTVVADGDLVMVHGRHTGWGPKPMVAVDIFHVEEGKVVEHRDVMQQEVVTVSGHAMFTRSE